MLETKKKKKKNNGWLVFFEAIRCFIFPHVTHLLKNGRKLEIFKLEVSLSLVFYVLREERHKKIVKIKIYHCF